MERVVGGVGAAGGDAGHAHRLAVADVLVGEAGAGVGVADHVAAQVVVGERHGGVRGRVVDPVDAVGADGERGRRDVGRGAGGGVLQRVVGGVGAADGDAGHAHRLAVADVLVGEAGAGVGVADHVAAQVVVGERHGGVRGRVVDS